MSKSRKHRHNKEKRKHKRRRTIKHRKRREIILPTSTPLNVRKVSNKIARKLVSGSYAPTINQELVTLKSRPRKELSDCNIAKWGLALLSSSPHPIPSHSSTWSSSASPAQANPASSAA